MESLLYLLKLLYTCSSSKSVVIGPIFDQPLNYGKIVFTGTASYSIGHFDIFDKLTRVYAFMKAFGRLACQKNLARSI